MMDGGGGGSLGSSSRPESSLSRARSARRWARPLLSRMAASARSVIHTQRGATTTHDGKIRAWVRAVNQRFIREGAGVWPGCGRVAFLSMTPLPRVASTRRSVNALRAVLVLTRSHHPGAVQGAAVRRNACWRHPCGHERHRPQPPGRAPGRVSKQHRTSEFARSPRSVTAPSAVRRQCWPLLFRCVANLSPPASRVTGLPWPPQVDKFRAGETWYLVATDLMARGVDFVGVASVLNLDFPSDPIAYIHRIGRTGRAGQSGAGGDGGQGSPGGVGGRGCRALGSRWGCVVRNTACRGTGGPNRVLGPLGQA